MPEVSLSAIAPGYRDLDTVEFHLGVDPEGTHAIVYVARAPAAHGSTPLAGFVTSDEARADAAALLELADRVDQGNERPAPQDGEGWSP